MMFQFHWMLLFCVHILGVVLSGSTTPTDAAPPRLKTPLAKEVVNAPAISRVKRLAGVSPQVVPIPFDYNGHEEHENNNEISKYQHPVGSEERSHQSTELHLENYQPGMSAEKNPSVVDKPMKELFSRVDENGQDKRYIEAKQHYKLPSNMAYRMFIPKSGLNTERKRIQHNNLPLLPSILGSSQMYPEMAKQQGSEDLLQQILGSSANIIDKENSNIPIKDAYLTKTTTYNITKVQDTDEKNSFLLEKRVNFSTNLNYLDSKDRYTNYADARSTVLKTIIDAKETLEHKSSDDFVGGQFVGESTDNGVKKLGVPIIVNKEDIPTDFVGGQFVKKPGNSDSSPIILNSKDSRNKQKVLANSVEVSLKETSDKIKDGKSDLPIAEDKQKHPVDFVGGQYISEPGKTDNTIVESSNPKYQENTSHAFVGGQFIPEKDNRLDIDTLLGKSNFGNGQKTPADFVGGQFVEKPDRKIEDMVGITNSRHKEISPTDFVGGQFIEHPEKKDNEILGSSNLEVQKKDPTTFVSGQYIGELGANNNIILSQPSHGDKHKHPVDFVGGQFIQKAMEKKTNFENEVQTTLQSETTMSSVEPEIPILGLKESVFPNKSEEPLTGKEDVEIKMSPTNPRIEKNDNNLQKLHDNNFVSNNDRENKSHQGKLPKSKNESDLTESSTQDLPQTTLGSELIDINDNENISGDTIYGESTTILPTIISNNRVLPINSENSTNPNLWAEHYDSQGATLPASKKEVVFEATDNDVGVTVSVSSPSNDKTQERASSLESSENSIESQFTSSENKVDNGEHSEENVSEYDKVGRALTTSSSESEEYVESIGDVGEYPNSKDDESVLEKDPETGSYVTEMVENLPSNVTESRNSEVLGETYKPGEEGSTEVLTDTEVTVDNIMGDFSSVQPTLIEARDNDSSSLVSNDGSLLGAEHDDEPQIPHESTNISNVVEDVELYVGKNYNTERGPEEYANVIPSPHPDHSENVRIPQVNGSKQETLTHLCLPLKTKKSISLLDFISNNYYLEKDGKRIPLLLRENPLQNCTSGSKTCMLIYDFRNNSNPLDTEDSEDVGLCLKKNEKRHVVEENIQLIKSEPRFERSTEEIDREASMETMEPVNKIRPHFREKFSHYLLRDLFRELSENSPEKESSNTPNYILEEYSNIQRHSSEEGPTRFDLQTLQPRPGPTPLLDEINNRNTVPQSIMNKKHFHPYDLIREHRDLNRDEVTLHHLESGNNYENKIHRNGHMHNRFRVPNSIRPTRTILQKKEKLGAETDQGSCGCSSNSILASPVPNPGYNHFVGKRLAILKNIVHTAKDWALETNRH